MLDQSKRHFSITGTLLNALLKRQVLYQRHGLEIRHTGQVQIITLIERLKRSHENTVRKNCTRFIDPHVVKN